MSSSSQIVTTFLRWCAANDIWIDPRIQIVSNGRTGAAIHTKNDHIPAKTSLVHIHRSSVLSVRSCCLSDVIQPIISGPEAQLSLSLALYAELLLGDASRWSGYLQSLPEKFVPLPLFWTHESRDDDDLTDGKEGLEWLRGTEVERQLSKHPDHDPEKINKYYFASAEPLLLRWLKQLNFDPEKKPSLSGFYRAYALVSSRAFLVDAFHGLSLVPVADIFNHSQGNHVHLETEFDVCSYCGLLEQCPHDALEPQRQSFRQLRDSVNSDLGNELDSYYEMVSVTSVQPNEEVFNTYGETLTNAQLLAQYGFILDVNENDQLNWDFEEVYNCYQDSSQACPLNPAELQSVWQTVLKFTDSDAVSRDISKSTLISSYTSTLTDCLYLDGEGKVSYQLWVLLALPICSIHTLEGDRKKPAEVVSEVYAVLKALLTMEGSTETDDDRADDDQETPKEQVACIIGLAYSLMNLCVIRRSGLGKRFTKPVDLNKILDELPTGRIRTRNALNVVISEQSILDSCISIWGDVTLSLNQ